MSFFVIAAIVLFFVILFQIAKASEYVSVLKGEEKANQDANKVNGALMVVFLVLGLFGIYWCQKTLGHKILPVSASVEGLEIDKMMWWSLGVTGIVLVLTQVALFYFAYKYQYKPDAKPYYYPHNTKLEVIWTAIPAVVMTGLVLFGIINWVNFTKDAPPNAYKVGVVGKQFGWFYHYPGPDGKLGKRSVRNIIPADNEIGLDLNDPNSKDDIVLNDSLYLLKDSIVDMTIQSRDVIHDVGLTHFRMKMDAVPDMPTKLKFTPRLTTEEMRKITNDPDFVYEISCDQMCGANHYAMKGLIYVAPKNFNMNAFYARQTEAGKSPYQEMAKKKNAPAAGDSSKPMVAANTKPR
jgi:cytochrome c oxidase subunit II